ncbi:MAG: hypothetical protein H6Q29_1442, partial [Bacteroidetes bacterium]|nr:hypothetical protein [Bacteroidota bacterium]
PPAAGHTAGRRGDALRRGPRGRGYQEVERHRDPAAARRSAHGGEKPEPARRLLQGEASPGLQRSTIVLPEGAARRLREAPQTVAGQARGLQAGERRILARRAADAAPDAAGPARQQPEGDPEPDHGTAEQNLVGEEAAPDRFPGCPAVDRDRALQKHRRCEEPTAGSAAEGAGPPSEIHGGQPVRRERSRTCRSRPST